MDARAHFLQLARYNVWATRRLVEAVAEVSEADYRKDSGLFFKSIHGTLNHLLVGEHMLWYPRFARGVSPKAGAGRRGRARPRPAGPGPQGRLGQLVAADRKLAGRAFRRRAELHQYARSGDVAALRGHAGPRVQPRHAPPRPDHGGAHRARAALPGAGLVYLLQEESKA
jgi:hypothetical protein